MASNDSSTATLHHTIAGWPTWQYPSHYDVYCTRGHTVPGESHPLVGAFFIVQYVVYVAIYIPSLVVIGSRPLIEHSCYKLMFAYGLLDIVLGAFSTLGAGIFSIMGANYCDNTRLLIVVGHLAHVAWYAFCMTGALLAFNRYVEMHSSLLARRLFGGNRCWLWMLGPACYAALLSSDWDIPLIYNSVWAVFIFAIDLHDNSYTPTTNWFCFANSIWVMCAIALCYALLIRDMRKHARKVILNSGAPEDTEKGDYSRMQRRVLLQSFFICGFLFTALATYAMASFLAFPLWMLIYATTSVQILMGSTSFVYLTFNKSIRTRVIELLLGKWFPCAKRLTTTFSLRRTTSVHPTKSLGFSGHQFGKEAGDQYNLA